MKNKGYTLIEILLALGLLTIIGGISVTSYTGFQVNTAKKELKFSSDLFQRAFITCIKAIGDWQITLSDGTTAQPCNTDDTPDDTEALKTKLNFTCPPDATCDTHTHTGPVERSLYQYTCLDIRKEVSGKKLQIITYIKYSDPSITEVWCNEVSTYIDLGNSTCRELLETAMTPLIRPCPWK